MNETNFTVFLELTPEDGVSYSANVVPFAELDRIRIDTWQFVGSYNISYNVRVVAKFCDENSTSAIDILEYGKFYLLLCFHY